MSLRLCARGMLLCLATVLCAGAWAQQVNEFPKPDDPLHVRVDLYDKMTLGNHWNEGTIMQHIVFPPAGTKRPLVGSQEDVAAHTAIYLAAYSHRYYVTKDEEVRETANRLMDGLLLLERVTGVPGCVARSLNRTDKPLWHEQQYFFPFEWHESKSMPGYRWQGDLSSDKFTDFFYGVGTYFDFCADDEHKRIAADFIDRFVGRCVDHNFRLVDYDGKTTLWGNFCPDLPHENLNALEMLAGLKTAYHMTGKDRYRMAYRMLIDRYGYDDQAINAKLLWPPEWTVPWDDELAAKSLYNLLRYEDDPDLLQKYRMCLNRHWFVWQKGEFKHPMETWFHMLYALTTGENVVDARVVEAIKNMPGIERKRSTFQIPAEDGTVQAVESEEENAATDMVHNYWFGVRYGFIDPAW